MARGHADELDITRQELPSGFALVVYSYLVFLLVDFIIAFVAYLQEPREDRQLLVWLPIQRFFYRQLLYYVAVKSFVRALAGMPSGWRTVARKATVAGGLSLAARAHVARDGAIQ